MKVKYLLPSIFALAAISLPFRATPEPQAHPQQAQQTPASAGKKRAAAAKEAVHQDDGQRVFQQNCARCHTAPDGFSPRISGTVVRHMRVRASLSQQDEEELLRFLNP